MCACGVLSHMWRLLHYALTSRACSRWTRSQWSRSNALVLTPHIFSIHVVIEHCIQPLRWFRTGLDSCCFDRLSVKPPPSFGIVRDFLPDCGPPASCQNCDRSVELAVVEQWPNCLLSVRRSYVQCQLPINWLSDFKLLSYPERHLPG